MKETSLGRLSCVTKRRPPLSHMISLFIKDTTTSELPWSVVGWGSFQGVFSLGSISSSLRPHTWQRWALGTGAGTVDAAGRGAVWRTSGLVSMLRTQWPGR